MAEQRSKNACPNRMRDLRTARGISQTRLSELTGFTQAQISRWERNEFAMSARTAVLLARALGCTVEELVDVPHRPTEAPV